MYMSFDDFPELKQKIEELQEHLYRNGYGDVIQKLTSIEKLPHFTDVINLYNAVNEYVIQKGDSDARWETFCDYHKITTAYNIEFMYVLSMILKNEIEISGKTPVVEVCAGNGKLTYHLKRYGIDIVATDDYSWGLSDPSRVEKMDHIEAIKKYRPGIVIASWPPDDSSIIPDILSSKKVKTLIYIGDKFEFVDDMWFKVMFAIEENDEWEFGILDELEKYSIGVNDRLEIKISTSYIFVR